MIGTIPLLIFIIFLVITIIKKRRQVGKTWSGLVTAKIQISGKELCCKHCENLYFQKREGILTTSLVCLFRFNFWNQSAVCYTCAQCGYVEWFVKAKEERVEFHQNK